MVWCPHPPPLCNMAFKKKKKAAQAEYFIVSSQKITVRTISPTPKQSLHRAEKDVPVAKQPWGSGPALPCRCAGFGA